MKDLETLRRAATVMRERADAATTNGQPWSTADIEPETQAEHRALGTYSAVHDGTTALLLAKGFEAERRPLVQHVAGWHPVVALAIAAWLDACADFLASEPGYTHDGEDYALTIARAYLGGDR